MSSVPGEYKKLTATRFIRSKSEIAGHLERFASSSIIEPAYETIANFERLCWLLSTPNEQHEISLA